MPRKTDIIPIKDVFIDRRTKMLPCQKEMCKHWYKEGVSISALARMFHVNKRTIQFLLFPERMEKNKADRKARGGTKQYYVKEKHTKAIKEHRNYKKKVFTNIKNN